jgi:gliding motility-associated-like protein
VTVAAGTTVGTYNVTYELCDKLTPQSCATVSNAITVTAAVNPVTETGSAPSTGGTVFTNIVSNDKVNGVPATLGTTGNAIVSTMGTWPVGITLDPSTGAVTVAAGTTPAVYTVVYELCDKLTPQSCATVSNAITVTAAVNPVTETGTAPSTGGTVFGNIASNDKINGVPATLGTTGNATVSESGTWPTGIALDPSTGAVTVAAGTTPAVYTVVYELCDKLTPQSCTTVSNAITVTATVNPVKEDGAIPSTGGTVFGNIASNDTVNGVPAVLGTTGNAIVSTMGTWPVGITLDPLTGTVTVAAGTTPAVYNVVYTLCDKLTPQSCTTVSNAITVTPVINPIKENGTIPSTGGTAVINVILNDFINGAAVNIGATGNATITAIGSWPAGMTLDLTTGKITVAAGTTPAVYNVVYELCDKLTPQNCATVSDVITVTPMIIAVREDGTIPSSGGTVFGNISSNDTVNGVLAVLGGSGNATIKTMGTWPTGITLDPLTGKVTVAAGTAVGVYNVAYELCDKLTPQSCATVSDAITVTSLNSPPVASSDTKTTNENTPISIVVTVNDTDVDGTIDVTSVDLDPATAGIQNTFTIPGQGTFTVDNLGVVTFAPALNYNGIVNPLNYTVNDNLGLASNIATINITIMAVDTVPIANNDSKTTNENTVITIPITANDTDFDGTIDVTTVDLDPATAGIQNTFVVAGQGTYTVSVLGIVTFTPVLNFYGTATPIYYRVNDNEGGVSNVATISIIVLQDSDGDGIDNTIDIDDDNDGITDIEEENGDPTLDTDKDGIIDTQDLDSDGDGIWDTVEAGHGEVDANNDGVLEGSVGKNGLPDKVENGNDGSGPDYTPRDSDGDGIHDFQDVDDDGDGLLTKDEYPDPNGDGNVSDAFDSDADGKPDYLDSNAGDLLQEDDIEIFNAMSPGNSDGSNDIFVIRNIELYPENTVEIYNRWGVLVYETKGYNQNSNFFKGISDGRVTVSRSEELPEGTYFYIVKYKNASGTMKQRSGYLYINR